MLAKEIVAQMPEDVRARAEAKAAEVGLTLEAFVQEQISAQLSEEELDAVTGGRVDTSLVIRLDQGPGGTTGGVGATFKF